MQIQNLEAEQAVLGSMIIDAGAIDQVTAVLRPDHFHREVHREIFSAITEVRDRGSAVDLITLTDEITKRGQLEEIGGIAYLTALAAAVPTTANVADYAKLVRDTCVARRLSAVYRSGPTKLAEADDIHSHLDTVQQELLKLSQDEALTEEPRRLVDVIGDRLQAYEERQTDALKTGFLDLDVVLSGLHPGDLVVLAARPSMGKTSLARAIIRHVATKKPALFFSLEMSLDQQVDMLLATEARIPTAMLRNRTLTEADWVEINKAIARLGDLKPLIIVDRGGMTTTDVRAWARRMKGRHPDLGLVAIDYLGLLADKPERGDNLDTLIGRMTRTLKQTARELNVPIMVLSQLNRRVDRDFKEHRPGLADLRSSGNIEQDADVVLFIYRDEYYDPKSDEKGIAEIIVAKHRNGPTGTIKLKWLPEYATFANLETHGRTPEPPSVRQTDFGLHPKPKKWYEERPTE